jgi:DNA-binding transcriptional regulator YiaG
MRSGLQKLWGFARGAVPSEYSTVASQQPRVSAERRRDGTDLRSRLSRLGTTQAGFAEMCNVHPNTEANWVNGRTRINPAAAVLLDILEGNPTVRWTYGIGVKRRAAPRGRPFTQGNPYRFEIRAEAACQENGGSSWLRGSLNEKPPLRRAGARLDKQRRFCVGGDFSHSG